MRFDPYTVAGACGAASVIAAYFATQQGWMEARDRRYQLANLVGACLILISLAADWNLPSAVIEGFWAAISLHGLLRTRARAR